MLSGGRFTYVPGTGLLLQSVCPHRSVKWFMSRISKEFVCLGDATIARWTTMTPVYSTTKCRGQITTGKRKYHYRVDPNLFNRFSMFEYEGMDLFERDHTTIKLKFIPILCMVPRLNHSLTCAVLPCLASIPLPLTLNNSLQKLHCECVHMHAYI